MGNIWLVLIMIVIASIALIILALKKSSKSRKKVFKKSPGDYPEPKEVKSEFDIKD